MTANATSQESSAETLTMGLPVLPATENRSGARITTDGDGSPATNAAAVVTDSTDTRAEQHSALGIAHVWEVGKIAKFMSPLGYGVDAAFFAVSPADGMPVHSGGTLP